MAKQSTEYGDGNHISLIALGSNLGWNGLSALETVLRALDNLKRSDIHVVATSGMYKTPAFPKGSGPDFVNAAVAVTSNLNASQMLSHLHQIESDFDRTRDQRWAPRSLDLDLLAHGGDIEPDLATFHQWADLDLETQKKDRPTTLILPHPRLQDRAFVLVPLMDIAPDWVHPVTGKRVKDMHDELPKDLREEVQLID